MREEILWRGDGIFDGDLISRLPDGSCVLQFRSGHHVNIGQFLRISTELEGVSSALRERRLSVRLTEDEMDAVQARADRAALLLSDYVRTVLKAQP